MKILIVDDERMICEWLTYCIEQDGNCQLTGCAHNGEQALTLFEQLRPDVVFTDIRMPVMDGITLLKKIKALSPDTLVVLLTAFAEFDLVREAVRNGGDDYLLKTEMNHQSFQEVLLRLKQKLSEIRGTAGSEESERTDQQHYIVGNILRHRQVLTDEDINKLRECNIQWRDGDLFALAFWKRNLLEKFTFPENREIHHLAGFEYDSLVYVVVGNLARNLTEHKKHQILYGFANQIVNTNQCMAGVSSLADSLFRVGDLIGEAVYSLGRGYYETKIKVYQSDIPLGGLRANMQQWETDLRAGRRKLHSLDGQAFVDFLEEILSYIRTHKVMPVLEVIRFCWDAMEAAARYSSEDGELMNRLLCEERKKAEQAESLDQMVGPVMEFVEAAVISKELDLQKLSKSVEEAVEFIRRHYQESISLEQVSSAVHLNPEYLSRIFKEETGCTYSMFLSRTRLKKAAYLLSHTTERVQKIAEQVGYPNVSYFSTIFKKHYGVNPYEYRRGE